MRLPTTKQSLIEDVRLARQYLRDVEAAILAGDWESHATALEDLEALCSASRCAGQENAL